MSALRLLRFHLLSYWNWKEAYVGRSLEPIFYMIFLVAGVGGMVQEGRAAYFAFSLSGLAVMQTFRAGLDSVSDVANDRKWGVFAMHRIQGGSIIAYFLSILMFSAIFSLGILAVLSLVYVLLVGGVPDNWLMLVASTVLGSGFWVGLGVAVGAKVDSYAQRDLVVSLVSLPVVFSAPLFYSMESAPIYLQWIARFNPLTYQVEWTRNAGWQSLLFLAIAALLGSAIGVFALTRAGALSRERL